MTLGGLELCVSQYLGHAQSGLRWRAAELIASCAQNMPQVQIYLLSIGTLPKLLQLTDSDPNPTVRVKALYAVSCEYHKNSVVKTWLKKLLYDQYCFKLISNDAEQLFNQDYYLSLETSLKECKTQIAPQRTTHFRVEMQFHSVGISGIVREQEAGLQAFLSHDGFSLLMRGMQSENEKLRTKSAFLLLNLLTANPKQKGMRKRGSEDFCIVWYAL